MAIRAVSGPDHPRLRGEHVSARWCVVGCSGSSPPARGAPPLPLPAVCGLGSSPPARGAQCHLEPAHVGLRIIPACAGSTGDCASLGRGRGDHPRLRGEHSAVAGHERRPVGSSPPARGARRSMAQQVACRRIIPACAGSTTDRPVRCRCRADHPRLRGEHLPAESVVSWMKGSSPPARGALERQLAAARLHRIIPACAGSTPVSGR